MNRKNICLKIITVFIFVITSYFISCTCKDAPLSPLDNFKGARVVEIEQHLNNTRIQ